MSALSFSDINQYLEEHLPNLKHELQGERFHYVKLAQHALVYHYQKNTSKILPNRLMKPISVQRAIFRAKALKFRPRFDNSQLKEVLIIDSGRTFFDENQQPKSVYFTDFIEGPHQDKVTHCIAPSGIKSAPADLHLKDIPPLAQSRLTKEEVKVLQDLQEVLKQLFSSEKLPNGAFDQISSAFHRFFEEFHFYFTLLNGSKVKKVVSTNHYHQEGLIAACLLLDIKFVEVQHGLICSNDLYYVYKNELLPEGNLNDAFFPHQLMLYGSFWQDMLSKGAEHRNTEVVIGGDYVFKKTAKPPKSSKENAIFIGAQKNLASDYTFYILNALKHLEKHPDWALWVKLHPLEKESQRYYDIKHPQLKIFWNESDLLDLLSRCKVQVSVYSTTLYDALGMDVVNLSLQNFTDYRDYAAEMVETGVAIGIQPEDDPVEVFEQNKAQPQLERSHVYAPKDLGVINKIILE